jgi:hypothetical protein
LDSQGDAGKISSVFRNGRYSWTLIRRRKKKVC